MVTETNQGTTLPPSEDFDTVSQKGWEFFTKFLMSNVIGSVLTLAALAIIFTVWK